MTKDSIEEFDQAYYVSLKTYRKNGSAVAVPLWHVVLDERLFMFTDGRSYKVGRINRNPAAEVAICGWRGEVIGPWVGATAKILGTETDDLQLVQRGYKALHRKYGWKMKITDLGSWAQGKIEGRAQIEVSPVWPQKASV